MQPNHSIERTRPGKRCRASHVKTLGIYMSPDLQLEDPLSQIVFIHDYLQLVFQDCAFTIYNRATFVREGVAVRQGEAGFCDLLVSLIDQNAQAEARADHLLLKFTNGAEVVVPTAGPDAHGAEAWQFGRLGGPCVVEQNA